MSMKKFTKKMLAIVAAGAMTMGLAMPAMAPEMRQQRLHLQRKEQQQTQ